MSHSNRFCTAAIAVFVFLLSADVLAQIGGPGGTSQRERRLVSEPANELTGSPSPVAKYGLLCYSFKTGRLVDTCAVEFHLEGIGGPNVTEACVPDANGEISRTTCGNGGHTHGPPDFPQARPLTLNDEPVLYPGDTLTAPGQELDVAGFSPLNTDTGFTWKVPQVAGIYSFNAKITATPGFAFFFIPTKITTLETLGTLRVTQTSDGYQQIPASPSEYALIRGGRNRGDPVGSDPDHFDTVAFGASEITHTVIPLIASEYGRLRGRLLSINDISLPMGGVFDDDQNWTNDHKTHRKGNDVDLNQDGKMCLADLHLRTAVNKFLVKLQFTDTGKPRPFPSALLCESGGRKHIDITWLTTGPII